MFRRWFNICRYKKYNGVRYLLAITFFFITVSCQGQHHEAKHDWSQWLGYERLGVWHLELSKDTLVDSDLLILQLGGSPDACLVALNIETGEEVWRSLDDEASYSAPIVIDQAGKVCWCAGRAIRSLG